MSQEERVQNVEDYKLKMTDRRTKVEMRQNWEND